MSQLGGRIIVEVPPRYNKKIVEMTLKELAIATTTQEGTHGGST